MNDLFIKKATAHQKKKAETTEDNIEDTYVKFAKNNRCNALKLIILNKRGFPDRATLCPSGRILFIEFKRKGKKQTTQQFTIMTLLKSYGFKYYVCDKIGQAEQHLKDFLSNA